MNRCCFCNHKMLKIRQGKTYDYYRCPRCHWYSTSLRDVVKEPFVYCNTPTFDADGNRFEEFVYMAEHILTHKFKIVGRIPESFLDVGCSEGPYVKAFNNITPNGNGVGVEADLVKVERAQKRGLNVVSVGEIPDAKFDFVYMRHVVEHIEDPAEFIDYYVDYVAEGGVFCIETPNCGDIKDVLINKYKLKEDRYLRKLYPPTHVCGYEKRTFKEIFRMLEAKGFRRMEIITYDSANHDWMFDSYISMNIIRKVTEKLGCAQNIAVMFYK